MSIPSSQRRALAAIAGLLAATAAAPTAAESSAASPWVRSDFADVRLVSAVSATGDLATLPLGVQIRLPEGWKTYWRSPGDAGFPPSLDWAGSENLAGAGLAFPVPGRFTLFGLDTFGYADEVVFPLAVRPERPGEPVALRGKLSALVCSDVCVPLEADLALALPAGPAAPTAFTQLVSRYQARVPGPGTGGDLAVEAASLVREGDRPAVELAIAGAAGDRLEVLVEGRPGWTFGPPRLRAGPGGRTLARLAAFGAQPADLAGAPLTVTVVDGDRFVEQRLTAEGSAAAEGPGLAALATMLAVAFLGGFILNLMPCVLPVLSLKLVGVVGYGGAERQAIRRGFLAAAAGILFSFLVLAGGAIALSAAGQAVGWGLQFQHAPFLAFMVVVLTLFAANLWGLFEVPLPAWIGGLGVATGGQKGLVGHFVTGAFATLLATPCSAPFLGTAVSFAFGQGPAIVLAIFTMLGLGLAAPYLAVAAAPGLVRVLPRPGPWMVWLRRLLGVALAGTAAWLVWVMAALVGTAGAGLVAALMAALVAALALPLGRARAAVATMAAAAALALPVLLPAAGDRAPGGAGGPAAAVAWTPFDRGEIARRVALGEVVFVDVTADWCVTCQVNKSVVLLRPPVADRLAGVRAMQADWTRPDPAIAEYLAGFNRFGIPFNAVYGPGAPRGIALPELLTADAVLDALAAAGPRTAER